MGGFLGIGNSSAKTDRGNQLAGINAEWNVYNKGLPLAESQQAKSTTTSNAGIASLEDAKKYWQDIVSGDKTAVMKSAQPAISAVNDQADAARNEQGQMGTSRGGGVNAGNQQAESDRMAQVSNVVAAQQPLAAKSIEQIGATEASIGGQQMSDALTAMGLSKEVADEIVNSSMQSRVNSYNMSPARGPEYMLGRLLSGGMDKIISALGLGK